MTYRSGPEWEDRFGLKRINPDNCPTLCPTFAIESYLEHQGEQFSTKYDPNSLLYISKVHVCALTSVVFALALGTLGTVFNRCHIIFFFLPENRF